MINAQKMNATNRLWISSIIPFDFTIRGDLASSNELVLLLHGYNESGRKILRKLQEVIPQNCLVLAPNGPFPMPYKKGENYKVGYSWYFYDPALTEYFIDMRVAVDYLFQGIKRLGLIELPKRVIGFSQGGYLAPFLTERIQKINHIIGIGAEYLVDEWPHSVKCRIDAVHGELDEVNSIQDSIKSYARIKDRNLVGDFFRVAGSTHVIDEGIKFRVSQLLKLD